MPPSIVNSLADLVTGSDFQQFARLQDQPNIFRALARTHTETWHSAFLGWLLDPYGSHRLETFPLRRFLAAVAQSELSPRELPPGFVGPAELATMVATYDFNDAAVLPNERNPREMVLPSGKPDVWIDVPAADSGRSNDADVTKRPLKIAVEVKVDAGLGDLQCTRYAEDLAKSAGSDGALASVMAVFVARTDVMKATSLTTTGDGRWYCIDFQALHDHVIVPCANHPDLSPGMRALVDHYLLNLRDPKGQRGRMAYTQDERRIAQQIFEKHKATFEALGELLREQDGFPEELTDRSEVARRSRLPKPRVVVDGVPIPWTSGSDLLVRVVSLIWDRGLEIPQLPYVCGRIRFLISSTPEHQDGSAFIAPKWLKTDSRPDLVFETNFSSQAIAEHAKNLLLAAGIASARVEPGEP